jgi:predicted RNA binding protein YcfA (HicA-like mRNA interferase family)
MAGITPVSWKKFEKFLFFVGCRFTREKGDHRIYHRDGLPRPLVVPRDNALPVFIIRNNLRVLGMDPQEYLDILKKV